MARPKSLIVNMQITTAARAHNCRQSAQHRIEKGTKRLTIKSDGNAHHYCLPCARGFFVKDLERMQAILAEIEADLQTPK